MIENVANPQAELSTIVASNKLISEPIQITRPTIKEDLENPCNIGIVRAINNLISDQFPRTIKIATDGFVVNCGLKALLSPWTLPDGLASWVAIFKDIKTRIQYPAAGKAATFSDKSQGDRILQLAIALGGQVEDLVDSSGAPIKDLALKLKTTLSSKAILVLGDDIGALSEVLSRMFGCQCVAIEYDALKVTIGKKGWATESGKPVRMEQGDIWHLLDNESSLATKFQEQKFDAIISWNLFNTGSGGDLPRTSLEYMPTGFPERRRQEKAEHFEKFISGTQWLLKDNGKHLHMRVDRFAEGLHTVDRMTSYNFAGADQQLDKANRDIFPLVNICGNEQSVLIRKQE